MRRVLCLRIYRRLRRIFGQTQMTPIRQFSLRTVAIVFVTLAVVLAFYARLRSESIAQHNAIGLLIKSNGDHYNFEEDQPHIGKLFGLDYPAGQVRLVKGPERSDWGVTPGWECRDEDLRLLKPFYNVDEVYLSRSVITDVGIQHLTQLNSLTRIEFRRCDLVQADLTKLSALPNLNKLNLLGCKVDQDVESLEAALPDCEVYELRDLKW